MTIAEALAELDAREAKIRNHPRAHRPAYKAFTKMCLRQIARERECLLAQQRHAAEHPVTVEDMNNLLDEVARVRK